MTDRFDADFDPAADFLAREKAAMSQLGDDDMGMFSSAAPLTSSGSASTRSLTSHDAASIPLPLSDFSSPAASKSSSSADLSASATASSASFLASDAAKLSLSDAPTFAPSPSTLNAFSNDSALMMHQQSAPISSSNPLSPKSPNVTGARYPSYPSPTNISPVSSSMARLNLDDSIYYREWKQRRDQSTQEADQREEEMHAKVLEKAQKEIEEFYNDYTKMKSKNAALNKEMELKIRNSARSPKPGEKGRESSDDINWKHVYSQVENVNKPKASKDTSRLKSILADLCNEPVPT